MHFLYEYRKKLSTKAIYKKGKFVMYDNYKN